MFSGNHNLSEYSFTNVKIYLSLAFQAGAINVGGFMACHRFVTHTTGFATFFGHELAQGHVLQAAGMSTVPLFFLIGAMLSAFFVDRRIGRNERPLYVVSFGLITLFLASVTTMGSSGWFGVFGQELELSQDYLLLALLCLSSGIQNATVSTAFHSVIRTTHLTGLTTDLGIGLTRVLFRSHIKTSRQDEIRANWIRTGIIFSFVMGSLLSAFIFLNAQYLGFLLPTLISSCLFGLSLKGFLVRHD